jgi:hypothetical protein
MKPERWQQIKTVFDEAVERSPAERERSSGSNVYG